MGKCQTLFNIYYANHLMFLTANAEVATVLGSIPASSDTDSKIWKAADEAVLNKVLKKIIPLLSHVYRPLSLHTLQFSVHVMR